MARLTRGPAGPAAPDLAPPAPRHPVWVIGDIHGRADLLDRLLAMIAARPPAEAGADLVCVGDAIDRGPDSAAVLQRLRDLSRDRGGVTCLLGNHERMLLKFLDDPAGRGRRWLRHGGVATLASYGVQRAEAASDAALAAALRDAMGADTLDWLRARPLLWRSGTLVVAHAALDPGRAVDAQPEEALLWGHPRFADTPRDDGIWVAHGHTVVDRAGISGPGRIATDTGAYETGLLTGVLVRPDGRVTALSTRQGPPPRVLA